MNAFAGFPHPSTWQTGGPDSGFTSNSGRCAPGAMRGWPGQALEAQGPQTLPPHPPHWYNPMFPQP